jgi:hypothetical protein
MVSLPQLHTWQLPEYKHCGMHAATQTQYSVTQTQYATETQYIA